MDAWQPDSASGVMFMVSEISLQRKLKKYSVAFFNIEDAVLALYKAALPVKE